MPTPSEAQRNSEFGVGSPPSRRSIFGNYRPDEIAADASQVLESGAAPGRTGAGHSEGNPGHGTPPSPAGVTPAPALQSSIDCALARAFIHRFLAKVFEDPDIDGWHWLSQRSTLSALSSSVQALSRDASSGIARAGAAVVSRLVPGAFDAFHLDYVTCFGHTVRGDCPMNEIEYGDIKADPLFQPHRLADLGAFYAAFGLEMAPDAAQRQDHISIELEFMSVLAAKETYSLEHQYDEEQLAICRDAQKKFLREHLGRWTPAFTRRLARMAGNTALGALADFVQEFISLECARFNVVPGSEDLLLRPVDDAESLCAQCGIHNLPPGATRSPVED